MSSGATRRRWWWVGTFVLALTVLLIVSWHLILMAGMERRIVRAAAQGEEVATILGDQLEAAFGDRIGTLLERASGLSVEDAVRVDAFANRVVVHVPVGDPDYRAAVELGLSRARSVLSHELSRRFDVYSMIVPLRVELARGAADEPGPPLRFVGWAVLSLLAIYVVWAGFRLWAGRGAVRSAPFGTA